MSATSRQLSLRQMVELTGISEFTLRGWENRYGAFRPRRTATGRRRYLQADLQKALLLKLLLERGGKIGQLAHQSAEDLKRRISPSKPPAPAGDAHVVIHAARSLSWEKLGSLLRKGREKQAAEGYLRSIILPLLGWLSRSVAEGSLPIWQEHIISAMVREELCRLRDLPQERTRANPRLLIAGPEGDYHDIGLQLAHTLAAIHGIPTISLGPNCPKREICQTAEHYRPTHLLMALAFKGTKDSAYSLLHFLDRHLPPKTAVLIGGPAAIQVNPRLHRPFHNFSDMEELTAFFANL